MELLQNKEILITFNYLLAKFLSSRIQLQLPISITKMPWKLGRFRARTNHKNSTCQASNTKELTFILQTNRRWLFSERTYLPRLV